jgi:hypothetical protein
LSDIGPTRWEKGRLPIFGITKLSTGPNTAGNQQTKIAVRARGEMGALPANAVLHPPHGVQFATHAKLTVDDIIHNGVRRG